MGGGCLLGTACSHPCPGYPTVLVLARIIIQILCNIGCFSSWGIMLIWFYFSSLWRNCRWHWGYSRLLQGTSGAVAAVYFDFLVLHVWNYTFCTDWSLACLLNKIIFKLSRSWFKFKFYLVKSVGFNLYRKKNEEPELCSKKKQKRNAYKSKA